jgi:5-(carboxyamino)imidazole ribonucleotide synthase
MADRLDYIGVFGLEFFVVGEGANETLVVNELAPRVHNSGHWTIEGAVVSQFEQHIRAVAGWPLGATTMRAAGAEMINLIGGEIDTWAAVAAEPGAAYHHYGKNAPRPGRKMGHVTRLLPVRPA